MLSIRMQRLGRKGYPTYRMVVQDKRQAPNSGKVIAYLGSYNPHTKQADIKKDVAEKFLSNGAHPSSRVVSLLKSEGVKIPKWVKVEKNDAKKPIKNPEKLRRNQPKEEPKPEQPVEETTSDEQPVEAPAEEITEEKSEESPAEESESNEEQEKAEEETKE